MIVPHGAKMPTLEHRKKRGFCKYHNFLGHKTSHSFLFMDLVQNAIKDERLKFGDKAKSQMKIDPDPLQVANAHYAEPVIVNMVQVCEGHDRSTTVIKTTEGFNQETNITEDIKGLIVKLQKMKITDGTNLEVNMVEVSKETKMEIDEESTPRNKEQVKLAYPKNEEILEKFLHRCQRKNSEMMLCPRCNSVFDKKVTKNIHRVQVSSPKRNWKDTP